MEDVYLERERWARFCPCALFNIHSPVRLVRNAVCYQIYDIYTHTHKYIHIHTHIHIYGNNDILPLRQSVCVWGGGGQQLSALLGNRPFQPFFPVMSHWWRLSWLPGEEIRPAEIQPDGSTFGTPAGGLAGGQTLAAGHPAALRLKPTQPQSHHKTYGSQNID